MKKIISIFGFIALFTQIFALQTSASFTDVDEYNEFYKAITWMEENGIVVGYDDGTFSPAQTVNRVEFLKMLYEILNVDLADSILSNTTFSDIPTYDIWYKPYLAFAYNNGVVDGYPDGTFKPENTINYAEAAKIVGNAFFNVEEVYKNATDFGYCAINADYYTGEWYWRYIGALDQSCIFPDSVIKTSGNHPSFEMTRGEMAELLYRAKTVKDNSENYDDLEIYGNNLVPDNVIEDNEFVISSILDKKSVGEWTMNDREVKNNSNFSVYFTGEVTLSGEYYHDGFWVCMNLDEESKAKMPKYVNDEENKNICFGNTNGSEGDFGEKGGQGTATVLVNKYFYDYNASAGADPWDVVDFVEILEQTPFAHEKYTDVEYLCESEPEATDIGRLIYPVDPKYDLLDFFGQLFTADDCGDNRIDNIFGVDGDDYILGSGLSTYQSPGADFAKALEDVGYYCGLENSTDTSNCTYWILDKTVKLQELLKLKDYYSNMLEDDCYLCG